MEDFKTLFDRLDTISDEVNVDAVFGKPQTHGDRVLIPVAEIAYGFGLGAGMAGTASCGCECCDSECECECECEREETEEVGAEEAAASPMGGGGAGGRARPIAYIEITPEGTRVQSIMDEQKIALAGIFLSAWAIGWVGLVLKTLFAKRS